MKNDGLEPYDGTVLSSFLVKQCGAAFVGQSGSHLRFELPNGARVGSLSPGNAITTPIARDVARALGMTREEFRAAIGYPLKKSGKARHKPQRTPEAAQPDDKRSMLLVIEDARTFLTHLERDLRQGQRDPAVYRRIHASVSQALLAMQRDTEHFLSPDTRRREHAATHPPG